MKIMACYDGSNESKEVLKEAMKHAKAFNGAVILVTSVSGQNRNDTDKIESIEQELKAAKAHFDENNINCKIHISYRGVDMDAGEDLVLVASREQVDEVIGGIRTRSQVGKFTLGSTVQWLMLKAECPVIGVKKKNQR